jgi:hypothetical protein
MCGSKKSKELLFVYQNSICTTAMAISISISKNWRLTIRDKATFLNEIEDSRVTSTMATTSVSTVQDVLDTQVDFVSRCVSSYFDAIT